MFPSLIEIGSKTAEKNSEQTNRQTNRHYENNGHLAVNQPDVQTGNCNLWVAGNEWMGDICKQYIYDSSKGYN